MKRPRGQVVVGIAQMKRTLRVLGRRWDIRLTVHEDGVGWRKRHPHELPENSSEHWATLHQQLGALVREADELRVLAEREYRRAREGEREVA